MDGAEPIRWVHGGSIAALPSLRWQHARHLARPGLAGLVATDGTHADPRPQDAPVRPARRRLRLNLSVGRDCPDHYDSDPWPWGPMNAEARDPVAVIVVTWNSADDIAGCLSSVIQATESSDEIVVVDNGSRDETVAVISNEFPNVRVIETSRNLGFAAGCNVGIAATDAALLLLLNPDARLTPDSLRVLTAEMTDRGVSVCGPRIVRDDGSLDEYSARRMPSAFRTFCRLVGVTRLVPLPALREALARDLGRRVADVPCLTGAALLVRRELLDAVQGLDPTMPMYLEDLELCDRARRHGVACRYVGTTTVVHAGGVSAAQSPYRRLLAAMEDGHAPWLLLRRTHGRFAAARYRAAVLFGSLLRIVVCAVARPFSSSRTRDRIDGVSLRARTLVAWATTSPGRFDARVDEAFDSTIAPEVGQ